MPDRRWNNCEKRLRMLPSRVTQYPFPNFQRGTTVELPPVVGIPAPTTFIHRLLSVDYLEELYWLVTEYQPKERH
ncbi:MAG: hypothetical protein M9887_04330 [Chitinophagales bacterium]|nr:hypothetical protein [Chitinophagales bacterium]